MAKWNNPIGIPFAENGDRADIPDTSEYGYVNKTTGFGGKYEIDPTIGGLWLYRQTMNSLFYSIFNSIKEIQTKVPISVNGTTPDTSGNVSIIIPDNAGIKVIDDNSPDITSFNQITKDGVYYIYKQLSDGPQQNGEAITYNYINLLVINIKVAGSSFNACIQATSFGFGPNDVRPGNIGSMPMLRTYDRNSLQWGSWESRPAIPFIDNNITISGFTGGKSNIKFPIIATDAAFPSGYNTFMYSATKEQMRAQLGITSNVNYVESWTTYTAPANDASDGTQTYNNISYCLFTRNINNKNYNMIKINCILSFNPKVNGVTDLYLIIPLPQNIYIYSENESLKNNVLSYIKYNCSLINVGIIGSSIPSHLVGDAFVMTMSSVSYCRVSMVLKMGIPLIKGIPNRFLIEIEAFVK